MSTKNRQASAGFAIFVLMACSSSNMAAEETDACDWNARAKLNNEDAALLSLIFTSPNDLYRPLRLRANADRSFVQGKYLSETYNVVDRSRPFELRINYRGKLNEAAVPSFVRERLYLEDFKYLDYPRHLLVLNEGGYDPSYQGYLNIIPLRREEFEQRNSKWIQSNVDEELKYATEDRREICRLVYEYSERRIEKIFLFVNYDYKKEDKRLQFSLCEARAYAMLSGYAAFTIPRMEKVFRESVIDVPGKGVLPYSTLIKPLADSIRTRWLESKDLTRFDEVCGLITSQRERS